MKTRFIPFALMAMLAAAPAFALEPLNTEKHINEALVAGRVADVIRNTCPSISAKMLTVLQELNALEAYLRDKGYTEAEVKAFRKNKDEKARIKGLANDYLTAAGYPVRSSLPSNYRAPQATPLATPEKPVAAASAPAPAAPALPPVTDLKISPSNPAGIQF